MINNKLLRLIFLSVVSVLLMTLTKAATVGDIVFNGLTNRDGLTNSHINAILKDSKGYVWFGTQAGLARYDGFRIKMFLYNNVNNTSLPNNSVDDIQQDANGNLWIHTSLGYCVYDYEKEQFDRTPEKRLEQYGIKGGIARVYVDGQKNLWVAIYGQGCYYIDVKTRKASLFPYPQKNKRTPKQVTLANDWITDFTAHQGMVVVTFGNGVLSKLDGKHHRIVWTNPILARQNLDKNLGPYTYIDSRGNYWVLNGSRCFIYATAQKKWYNSVAPFLASQGIASIQSPFLIRDMACTSDGRLWIATDHDGLILVDYQHKQCRQYLKNDMNPTSLPDNALQRVFVDDRDAVWIGTYKNGVAYFSPSSKRFSTIGLGDICCVSQDAQGNLWCGTNDNGIVNYNPVTGQSVRYGRAQTHLLSDVVVCSVAMSDGTLYFGTFNGGLARYRNGEWKTYQASPHGLANNSVWSLCEDNYHRLLIGTLGGGLQIFDPKTERFQTFDMTNSKLPSNYISSIVRARGDEVLLGHSQNISIFNVRTHTLKNITGTRSGKPFPSPSVNYAMMDSRGIIWIASPAGITMYDTVSDQMESVYELNGTQGAVGCSVVEDKFHSIWLVSEFLVSRVRLSKGSDGLWDLNMSSYNSQDGLQTGQFNYRSACLLSSHALAIGGQEGLNIIPTTSGNASHINAKVLFSGLVLFDHPLAAGEEYEGRVILKESIDFCRELELDDRDNAFTIQLASSEVAIPSRSRFLYRMEGVSDKWIMTPEGRPSITLTNLSPGNYTLQVKVVNGDGTVSNDVSQLRIHVRPPFYLSGWAMLAYVLLLVGVFFGYRKRMLDKQRAKYEQEKMKADIRKTKELNELKLNFFTNVSHELRTPLTLIISPLAAMIKKEEDSEKHHKLELIHRNALRLLNMVNQILDFRKMEQNRGKLVLSSLDVVDFVKGISASFQQLANNNIQLNFHATVPRLVMYFDVDKLGKIVNNLLSNAYKFTPDGGTVSVGLNVLSADDTGQDGCDMLRLTVADTGKGISDADKKLVFERFYQVNGTEMQPFGGSGIGLNLVMQFAQLHGGKVQVQDNPGGGTIFLVDIPIRHEADMKTSDSRPQASASAQGHGQDAYQPGNGEHEGGSQESIQQGGSEQNNVEQGAPAQEGSEQGDKPSAAPAKPVVLLVDDSDDFREFMHEELSGRYQVVEAINGQDAWQKIQQQRPDIILSDVMMPVMDGNELCRLVKGNDALATIPFVMLTARLADEHRKEDYENGADSYITKPFDVDILKTRIDNFLKYRHGGAPQEVAGQEEKKEQPEFTLSQNDKKFLSQVDIYIRDNMGDPDTSVEAMSNSLCISRVQLYKRMLALTGTTPSEYLRAKRIKRAEELLHSPDYNISEIAYMVGFNNPRYFSKYFQDAYGMTPSQYRKKLAD